MDIFDISAIFFIVVICCVKIFGKFPFRRDLNGFIPRNEICVEYTQSKTRTQAVQNTINANTSYIFNCDRPLSGEFIAKKNEEKKLVHRTNDVSLNHNLAMG